MGADSASTAGHLGSAQDVSGEFEAALGRLRRHRGARDQPQAPPPSYGPRLSAEEALALFEKRQSAYGLSIEQGLSRLTALTAGDRSAGSLPGESERQLAAYRFPRTKRVFDVALSAVCLVLLAPLMVALAIAVRLDSRGPVFIRTKRLGQNGRSIWLIKFRTMREDASSFDLYEHTAAHDGLFKIALDPRVTRVGRLLRRTSLDELPQVINVLRGHLSLVGPRPLLPDEIVSLGDLARPRLRIRPGMTGLSQIAGTGSPQQMLALDLDYATNWTLWLDFRILIRTVPAVLTHALPLTGGE